MRVHPRPMRDEPLTAACAMASAGEQSPLSFAIKPTRKSYMREEKSARSAISANPCAILNNAHHRDLWVGLSQLFILKRISLCGAVRC